METPYFIEQTMNFAHYHDKDDIGTREEMNLLSRIITDLLWEKFYKEVKNNSLESSIGKLTVSEMQALLNHIKRNEMCRNEHERLLNNLWEEWLRKQGYESF